MIPRRAFEAALLLHRRGQLQEAAQLYRAILRLDGKHAASLHYLGVICVQEGQFERAIQLLRYAISLDEARAETHNDLGVALTKLNRIEEAKAEYERALTINPCFAEAHNNLGLAFVATAQAEHAVVAFERATALKPGYAEAHANLGNALFSLRRHEAAVGALHRALAVGAENAETHHRMGMALAALNRHAQALPHYVKALEIRSDFAEAHNNLGNTLVALKRAEEGIAQYQQALEIRPHFATAHNNLAIALAGIQRLDGAIRHYQQALAIQPDLAEAHNNLGVVLARLKRHEEATAHFLKALSIKPDLADAHGHLGNSLAALNRYEAAISSYQAALTIAPNAAEIHAAHGNALRAIGRLEASREALEKAIALAPRRIDLYRSLSASKQFTVDDPHLAAMEALAADLSRLSDDERIDLHFGLGKAYADIDQHEAAFRHFLEGNALKRRQITYDEVETLLLFRRIARAFTLPLMPSNARRDHSSSVPVFIIGMPRSGTTLIEQILASHSAIFGAGETMEFSHALTTVEREDRLLPFPDGVASMTEQQFRRIGARYVDRLRSLAPVAERITDKGLANFCLIGLIHLALPQARMIHARRDPIDTCVSCFCKLFGDDLPYSYDLAELGRYYRAYDALMVHWRSVLPEGVMIEVRYEDLVTDFERQARRLVTHCGLLWDERCRSFHKLERAVQTASASQVCQPIYRSSVGRWRHYGNLLTPLLTELDIQ